MYARSKKDKNVGSLCPSKISKNLSRAFSWTKSVTFAVYKDRQDVISKNGW